MRLALARALFSQYAYNSYHRDLNIKLMKLIVKTSCITICDVFNFYLVYRRDCVI